MRKGKISFLLVFIFFIILVIISFLLIHFHILNNNLLSESLTATNKPPLPSVITPSPNIMQNQQVSAPDGTKQLIMKTTVEKNNIKSYSFFTADGQGNNQQLVFTNVTQANQTMTIPPNSWSPDGKYFFIQEDGKGWNDIFVMQASGANFPNGQKFLEVPIMFNNRKNGYTYKEVTGWASQTLIIVNTTKDNDSRGPSFWMEMPYGNFIQLAG